MRYLDTSLRRMVWGLALALAACTTPPAPVTPSVTVPAVETPLPQPSPTRALRPTLPPPPPSPTPWAPPPGFDGTVYRPPTPPAPSVQLTYSAACPNGEGLEESPPPRPEEVLALLQALRSEDPITQRQATDPAFWPLLPPVGKPAWSADVSPETLMKPRPGIEAPYGELLRNGCGDEVIKRTWWVEVCPGPCADPRVAAQESLKGHLFLIRRRGHWLIWAMR